MKLIVSALAAFGVFGALPMIAPEKEDVSFSTAALERKETLLRYQLHVSGRDGSCEIGKRGAADAERAELEVTEDCVALMPRLAEVRYWQEGATGDVTFAAADGRAIVEFFPADGVAYESLRPASPLVALTAQ